MNRSSRHLAFVLFACLAAVGTITPVVAMPVVSPVKNCLSTLLCGVASSGSSGHQQVASELTAPLGATTVFQQFPDPTELEPGTEFRKHLDCRIAVAIKQNLKKLPEGDQKTFWKESNVQRLKVIQSKGAPELAAEFKAFNFNDRIGETPGTRWDQLILEWYEIRARRGADYNAYKA
ncbi:hypothetical protein EV360DRAFT_74402 [Lentinula raphanica]|nr:hypothetical protein EV360DRAFT_74402 [Lentinula raphanica]